MIITHQTLVKVAIVESAPPTLQMVKADLSHAHYCCLLFSYELSVTTEDGRSTKMGDLLSVNIRAYNAIKDDKKRAEDGERRIPEDKLLDLARQGGIAGIFAMNNEHHKTSKPEFYDKYCELAVSGFLLRILILAVVFIVVGVVSSSLIPVGLLFILWLLYNLFTYKRNTV